jgi:hypothetical protein
MIVAKVVFTIFIIAGMIPFILMPAHKDMRPRNWRLYDWYDWTIIGSCAVMLLSAVVALLAFVWGI